MTKGYENRKKLENYNSRITVLKEEMKTKIAEYSAILKEIKQIIEDTDNIENSRYNRFVYNLECCISNLHHIIDSITNEFDYYFINVNIDTIINTPDSEILTEVEEEYGDSAFIARKVRRIFEDVREKGV